MTGHTVYIVHRYTDVIDNVISQISAVCKSMESAQKFIDTHILDGDEEEWYEVDPHEVI
jgi:hypothetical protein